MPAFSAITKPIVEAAKPAPKEIEWTQLDPDPSPLTCARLTKNTAPLLKAAATLRTAFEARMTNAIDPLDGEKVAFGYKFGKLSIAIVPADRPKPAHCRS